MFCRCQLCADKARCGDAGQCAIDYFKALPSDIGVEEDLDNEAEWIVDITTQADRQGRWDFPLPIKLIQY